MTQSTRRQLLQGLAAAGLLAGSGTAVAGSGVAASPLAKGSLPGPDGAIFLARMLADLEVGAPFFGEWVLVDAYPPVAGGVSLVVAKGTHGQPLRVDVVRRGDPVKAPAVTRHLELFTMDGGQGVRVLPDDLMDALVALAAQLCDEEAQAALAARLLTHGERVSRFPAFMDRAATDVAPVPPAVLAEQGHTGADLWER